MNTTEERSSTKRPASIQALHALALVAAVFLALVATITLARLFKESRHMEESHVRYEQCSEAAQDLMTASDFLTTQVRLYVLTGDEAYLNGYLNEVLHDKNRDFAVETIHAHLKNDDARDRLDTAFGESSNLSKEEMYAMKLVALATGLQQMPQGLSDVAISEQDAALDPDQMRERARVMVLGEEYQANKSRIVQNVDECTTDLIASLQDEEEQSGKRFDSLLVVLRVIVILLVAIVALTFLANYLLMIKPIRMHEQAVRGNNPLPPEGSKELRSFVDSYNQMYEENHRRTMLLKHEAETDPLTGLFNRGSYERLIEETGDDIALVLIDVDLFKNVNDTYGHEKGDVYLCKACDLICQVFSHSPVYRLGGDEFCVLLQQHDLRDYEALASTFDERVKATNEAAQNEWETIDIARGVAVYDPSVDNDIESVMRRADLAMYDDKHRMRAERE
jgi:diguanylate cyclase (GGDEF)-like protein